MFECLAWCSNCRTLSSQLLVCYSNIFMQLQDLFYLFHIYSSIILYAAMDASQSGWKGAKTNILVLYVLSAEQLCNLLDETTFCIVLKRYWVFYLFIYFSLFQFLLSFVGMGVCSPVHQIQISKRILGLVINFSWLVTFSSSFSFRSANGEYILFMFLLMLIVYWVNIANYLVVLYIFSELENCIWSFSFLSV